MKKLLFLAFIFFSGLFPSHVLAVGVSVEPANLDIIYPDQKTDQLKIKNISQEPIFSQVFSDDLKEFIQVSPTEFELNPGEVMLVDLSFDFDQQKSGIKNTNLSVVSRAMNRHSFNAASGIKIPLQIVTSVQDWKTNLNLVLILFSVFLIFIVLLFKFIIWSTNQQKKSGFDLDFLLHHKWWLFKKGKWLKLWRKIF